MEYGYNTSCNQTGSPKGQTFLALVSVIESYCPFLVQYFNFFPARRGVLLPMFAARKAIGYGGPVYSGSSVYPDSSLSVSLHEHVSSSH